MRFKSKINEQDVKEHSFLYYGGDYPGEEAEPFYHSGVTNYKVRVSVSSNIGKVRGNHEDNFYLPGVYIHDSYKSDFSASYIMKNPNGMCFAVFDGMGGAAYGEVASEIAVRTLRKYEKKLVKADGTRMLDQLISEFTTEANNEIIEMLEEKHCQTGGTTLALLYFMNDSVKIYYLGDSRVYRITEEEITRLTRDHTLANQKIEAAIMTEEQAKNSPDQHRLTLFVGSDRKKVGLSADSRQPVPVEVGYKFMLCSDGLSNMLSDQEIQTILQDGYQNEAEALVQGALEKGGTDNITCIVLEVLDAADEKDKK